MYNLDNPPVSSQHSSQDGFANRIRQSVAHPQAKLAIAHAKIPYLRRLPLSCILIICFLTAVNVLAWAACGIVLAAQHSTSLLGTAALAYSFGLRHALDADHISAIDLMTRRLIATGQRPVTVGTFFSLGHSTIVTITSIVVAATAAGISKKFNGFSSIGGVIGTSVSAAFLILLGLMNGYILYRLVIQIRRVIRMQPHEAETEAWKIKGGGCLFHILKGMFKLIDRPWKMYPLGVLFGMGFDTSSEIALLGISSIQGAKGTSIWLILIFPILFTAGMCLVDTADGALMMGLYVAPMGMTGDDKKDTVPNNFEPEDRLGPDAERRPSDQMLVEIDNTRGEERPQDVEAPAARNESIMASSQMREQVKDPLTFLYYSIVLTVLTVLCATVIGIIQLLCLVLNVAHPAGKFWDGVGTAGDNYDIIGGAICGSFVLAGITSMLCYRPFKRWVDRQRALLRRNQESIRGPAQVFEDANFSEANDMVIEEDDQAVAHGELVEVHHAGKDIGGRADSPNRLRGSRISR